MKTNVFVLVFIVFGLCRFSFADCSAERIVLSLIKMSDPALDNHPDSGETFRSEELLHFCGECGCGDSVMLSKLVNFIRTDKFQDVRYTALKILNSQSTSTLNSPIIRSTLIFAKNDADLQVRLAAVNLLIKLGQIDTSEIVDTIVNILKNKTYSPINKKEAERCQGCANKAFSQFKADAIQVLGKINNIKAKTTIEEFINDEDAVIQNAALKALKKYGGK